MRKRWILIALLFGRICSSEAATTTSEKALRADTLAAASAVPTSGPNLNTPPNTAETVNGVRFANRYATGGDGLTAATCWTGWESVFDSSPRKIKAPAGFYCWNTAKIVTPASGADRESRFEFEGDGEGVTTLLVSLAGALRVDGSGTTGAYGTRIHDFSVGLANDIWYGDGVFHLIGVLNFEFSNVMFYGGPRLGGGLEFNLYAGYLLNLDTSYTGSVRNVWSYARYGYIFEKDDSSTASEDDTIHFDNLFAKGAMMGIVRLHTHGAHNLLFTNIKYQVNIELQADTNHYDVTTTTGAQIAGVTSYGVDSSAAFHANDPVILDVGDRLEVNRVAAISDGSHIHLAHATRFGHARGTQVLHGGVGIGLTGNSHLIVFKNAMFEQCASGIMFDGLNFLDMEDVLSSCTEVAQLVGPSSTGGTTSLWHASFKNVELTRGLASDTMYVLRVRASGDSNNVRQVEFDHIEKNPSSVGKFVEYQNDAGTPRNYTLCKSIEANRVCEQHYTSELSPSSDVNSIYYDGAKQHAWQGNGNYTAAGTITAAAFAGNASSATALSADPAACLGTTVVKDIAANGTLTCSQPTLANLADYGNPCNSAGQSVRRNSTNSANECFTPAVASVGDVMQMSAIARATGSDSHGVVLWGVATSTDSGFDTGDKVCRAQGFACVTTFDTPGKPIACGTAHTSYNGWLAECK